MSIRLIFLVGNEAPSFPCLNQFAVCVIFIPSVKAVSRIGNGGKNHFFSGLILLTDIVRILILFTGSAAACILSMFYMYNSSKFRRLQLIAVAIHPYKNSVIPFSGKGLCLCRNFRLCGGFGMAVLLCRNRHCQKVYGQNGNHHNRR